MALAKTCLSEGLSLSETCYQSGFADYSNFIRSFTKLAGISPGKYTRKMKGNRENRIKTICNKQTAGAGKGRSDAVFVYFS